MRNGTQKTYGTAPATTRRSWSSRRRSTILSTPDNQPLFLMMTPFAPHGPATPYPTDKGSFADSPGMATPVVQ